ncbi:DUF503 domain-containing protein [Candidatus Aerophobetes bacterium]|uniref:DUF503 domain-containing protein n=1 Tax=Aerophobetes bacterium TaxID=2030807 RepID=A0A7V5LZG5_UNCAE|nr:DUF503 domain-containing protein [Candidatus Aerophobetes bacterium]HHF98012.1 DUF503 domain-containing protein [Candidatus Aerophobetes bacterium]
MVVGTLELQIRLVSSNSLKDKRRIVKSLISRIRNNFNVSIAEIGDYSLWRRARIGIAFLSSDTVYSNKVLDKILDFLEKEKDFFIIEHRKEIL